MLFHAFLLSLVNPVSNTLEFDIFDAQIVDHNPTNGTVDVEYSIRDYDDEITIVKMELVLENIEGTLDRAKVFFSALHKATKNYKSDSQAVIDAFGHWDVEVLASTKKIQVGGWSDVLITCETLESGVDYV